MTEQQVKIHGKIAECPHCGENMVGDPIPYASRELYGDKTHFSRLIGVSNGDSILYYKCPSCGKRINRADRRGAYEYRSCNVEVKR